MKCKLKNQFKLQVEMQQNSKNAEGDEYLSRHCKTLLFLEMFRISLFQATHSLTDCSSLLRVSVTSLAVMRIWLNHQHTWTQMLCLMPEAGHW
jgi:hypothetical protein